MDINRALSRPQTFQVKKPSSFSLNNVGKFFYDTHFLVLGLLLMVLVPLVYFQVPSFVPNFRETDLFFNEIFFPTCSNWIFNPSEHLTKSISIESAICVLFIVIKVLLTILYFSRNKNGRVFLIGIETFERNEEQTITSMEYMDHVADEFEMEESSREFLKRAVHKSGFGPSACRLPNPFRLSLLFFQLFCF